NPEAKPVCADGTALDRVWESRTPPNTRSERGPRHWVPSRVFMRGFFLCPTTTASVDPSGVEDPLRGRDVKNAQSARKPKTPRPAAARRTAATTTDEAVTAPADT